MAQDLERYFDGIKTVDDLYRLAFESKGWFKSMVRQLRRHPIQHKKLAYGDPSHNTKVMMVGKLYLFEYNAKHKDKLPIWDRYPLALPFSTDGKTFYALNLHYMPHKQRAWLLYQLSKIYNFGKEESTQKSSYIKSVTDNIKNLVGFKSNVKKMKLSWQLISGISKITPEDAVHRYLPNHIKTPLREIPPEDYPKIILLPFEKWVEKGK